MTGPAAGPTTGGESGEILSSAGSARGGLGNAAASLVGTVLTFAVTFVVTNVYGVESTGVFFAAVAVFMIVATATKLGAETALVLFVARFRAEGDTGSVAQLLRISLVPVALASIIAAFVIWASASPIAGLFDQADNVDAFVDTMRNLAPFVPAWSLSLCLLGATRGTGTLRPTAVGLQVIQPAAQLVLVVVGAAFDWSLARIAWCWALPIVATAVYAAWSLRRWFAAAGDAHNASPGARGEAHVDAGEFWRYAGARGVAGSLQMGLDRIGVVLVAALASAAIAGQWAAVARLVGVAQRFFHAIGQGLNPRISALAHQTRWSEVQRAVTTATDWTILVVGPVLIALAVFPNAALGLFGEDFPEGATGLIVAAAAIGGAVVFAHADNVLLMAGDASTAMVNTAAALMASVLLHIVLVPPYGVVGAALAMAGGVAVYRLSSAVQIRRRYGVGVFDTNTLRIVAVGLAFVLVPALVLRLIWGDRLVVALVAGVVCGGAYLLGVGVARSRSSIILSDLRGSATGDAAA